MIRLTSNQRKVFEALEQAGKPIGAYAILEQTGFRGAIQVYRALEKLIDLGLAKKLESLHAYICVSQKAEIAPTAFAICDHCGHIHQLKEVREVRQLHECLAQMDFEVCRSVIEIHGACSTCASRKRNK
ncbi:transcriptional repressor [Marinobacter sp.]|uniref:transcriptional repressor n=1 Tax=Marinobacter sp. TaxID=50741 RepID=UPI002B273B18|nr:transcriptional repressor [Marinobacter sp.]